MSTLASVADANAYAATYIAQFEHYGCPQSATNQRCECER